MQTWLNSLTARIREQKGMMTWIWIIILLVILGIGVIMGLPFERLDAPGEAALPPLGSTGQLVSVFLKWMAVIGLMYVAFNYIRRWQAGGINAQVRQLSVLERLSLSQKQAILLVKVGNRRLLVGATDQSISLITELDEGDGLQPEMAPDAAAAAAGGSIFSSVLEKKMTGNVSDFFGGKPKK